MTDEPKKSAGMASPGVARLLGLLRQAPWAGLLAGCLFLIYWIQTYGMQLFSGIDGGIMVNAAWQESLGGVPYRDFHTGAPPLFLLPVGWAFELWGPTWQSIDRIAILFSVITFVWSFFLIRDGTRSSWMALIISALLQAVVVLPSAWWWYNELTWVFCALFLASSLTLMGEGPKTTFTYVSFALLAAILPLLKVNLAAPLMLPLGLLLVLHPSLRRFILFTALGAAGADLAFLVLNGISPADLLRDYSAMSSRLNTDSVGFFLTKPVEFDYRWQFWAIPVLIVLLAVVVGIAFWRRPRRMWFWYAVLVILIVHAFIGVATNYQRKGLASACLIMLLPFLQVGARSPAGWVLTTVRYLALAVAVCLAGAGLIVGQDRSLFKYFGVYSWCPDEGRFRFENPPFFRGMRASPVLAETVYEIANALKKFQLVGESGNKKIFFGPDLDAFYAVFHLPPPKNFPLWWEKVPSTHQGDNYPFDSFMPPSMNMPSRWILPGEPLDPQSQRFLDEKFDACILLNDPEKFPVMTYLPGEIRAELYEKYEFHSYPFIWVLIRKPEPGPK